MKTVIVVDDEPITRMDIRETLVANRFQVLGDASDGFDAIELCRCFSPDVVLMDVKMPIFDGMSAAETIIRERLAVCVILLTSYLDHEYVDQAKDIGVTGYLAKPLDERLLVPTIEIAYAQSMRYADMNNRYEQVKQKLADKNLLDRAKAILAQKDRVSENEAYIMI